MSHYGYTLTRKGKELLAKVMAEKMPLTITRVMVGRGVCPDSVFPGDLEDLIDPVAEGTSDVPWYKGDTVHMTLEFRSDLNGGLKKDIVINEIGMYAKDLDGFSILLYYGALGDNPQKVCAFNGSGIDIRRFPVSIKIGEEASFVIDYSPEGLLTAGDISDYVMNILLPLILDEVLKALGNLGGGFVEMEESIPAANRTDDTLYGLILKTYD